MRLVFWPSLCPTIPVLLLFVLIMAVGAVGTRTSTKSTVAAAAAVSGAIASVAAAAVTVVVATQGPSKKMKKTTPKLIGNEQDKGESKTSHFKMGLAHFLFFLNSQKAEQETWLSILGEGPVTDVNDVPRAFCKYSNMDMFGQYMALYARVYLGDEESGNENLSVQTIENYFGAVKTYYTSSHPVYRDMPTMATFQLEKWKKLRANMIKVAKNRVHEANENVSTPRETISDDDYKIIAFTCWQLESLLMQSFLFLLAY